MEFCRANEPKSIDPDFKVADERLLNLDPVTENVQKLQTAGVFKQNPLMDFTLESTASSTGEPEEKQVTVYTAPAFPKGITTGSMFSDGTADIAIKVGNTAYARYRFPLHIQEVLLKLWRQNGLIPLGVETRLSAAKVLTFFFCFGPSHYIIVSYLSITFPRIKSQVLLTRGQRIWTHNQRRGQPLLPSSMAHGTPHTTRG